MRFTTRSVVVLGAALALVSPPRSARGWAIGEDRSGNHLAHQWITEQGWLLFKHQFGASEIDAHMGTVTFYEPSSTSLVQEGAYDEDIGGRNPWGETSGLEHPSTRHFWDHYSDFHRAFDDGIKAYDSAVNRSIKYFTGGVGFTGTTDTDWGSGPGPGGTAAAGSGIGAVYAAGQKGWAYYWLGHCMHLLQDVAMPAHAHADSHIEGFGPLDDYDPLHDYVDGRDFSTTNAAGSRGYADFNNINKKRYTLWGFSPGAGGVGRLGGSSFLTSGLLNNAELNQRYYGPGTKFPNETLQSVPAGFSAVYLPMYLVYCETAREGALYDSKDYAGQSDAGTRYTDYRTIDLNFTYYNNWTNTELDQVADVVVPNAMYATAQLIRFFYSRVDPTPPNIAFANLPTDINNPLRVALNPQGNTSVPINLNISDDRSGWKQNGVIYFYRRWTGTAWGPTQSFTTGPNGSISVSPNSSGWYAVWASIENGAGLTAETPYGYFYASGKITGTARHPDGTGIPGVTITENQTATSVVTDAQGKYELWVPAANWAGSIVAGKQSYLFVPETRSFASVTTATTGQDFIGAPVVTIGEAKLLPDESNVFLFAKHVTAQFITDFYIQEGGVPTGIRVVTNDVLPSGQISMAGLLRTANGERRLVRSAIDPLGLPAVQKVTFMNVRNLGGQQYGLYTPGVWKGEGLNNIGLLVRTRGNVSYVDPSFEFFLLQDGNEVVDPVGLPGVRVETGGSTPPEVGDCVVVTGIVSAFVDGGLIRPRLRVRNGSDIVSCEDLPGPTCNDLDGHCYEVVPGSHTWSEAAALASQRVYAGKTGHLITVNSAAERDWINSHMGQINPNGLRGWIGGYQDTGAQDYQEPGGGWRWVTGEPWSFTDWQPGEPNEVETGENFLQIYPLGGVFRWNDLRENALVVINSYWVEYE